MLIKMNRILLITMIIISIYSCKPDDFYIQKIRVTFKYNNFQVLNDTLFTSYTLLNNSNVNVYIPIYPLLLTGISHPNGTIFKYPTYRYGSNFISYYPLNGNITGITDNFSARFDYFPQLVKLNINDSIRINYYCPLYKHKIFDDSLKYIIKVNFVFYSETSIVTIEKFFNKKRDSLCYNNCQSVKSLNLYPYDVKISPQPKIKNDIVESEEAQIIEYHFIPSDIRTDKDDYDKIRSLTDIYYNKIWFNWKKENKFEFIIYDSLVINKRIIK